MMIIKQVDPPEECKNIEKVLQFWVGLMKEEDKAIISECIRSILGEQYGKNLPSRNS